MSVAAADWRGVFAALTLAEQERIVASLPAHVVARWAAEFPDWAHDGQRPPAGDWRTWVIMGGRGFGKTRAGAEWVLAEVRAGAADAAFEHGRGRPAAHAPTDDGAAAFAEARRAVPGRHPHPSAPLALPPSPSGRGMRVALVGATIDDARAVMVEGPSGLLACARPGEIAAWRPAERTLMFANGAVATLYSGRSPQGLRGPEHDLAWADELGKWAYAQAAWDMLQLGLRRGPCPRAVVTTTPSSEPALARLLDAPGTVATGGATQGNPHLPAAFLDAVERQYAGTRLWGPEVAGLLPAEREGALWSAASIAGARGAAGAPVRVVVGVDPPASVAGTCGIVVAALDGDGRAWVLADASVAGASPDGWARAVAAAAAAWGADRVIAEANQGGDMVGRVLHGADGRLPVRLVRASRGKWARAEPVAALFERGEAGLAGVFPALEAELAGFVAGAYAGEGSPDRADAMIWALWALKLEGRAGPRVLTF